MTTEKKEVSADDFDAAFAEAVQSIDAPAKPDDTPPAKDDTPPAKPDDTPPAKPDDTPPAKPDDTPPAKDDTPPAKPDDTPPAKPDDAAAAAAAAAAKPDPVTEAAQRAAAETAARMVEEQRKAQEAAEAKRTAEAEARKKTEAAEIKDPVLTEEDKKLIEAYKKEWPEQAVVIDKMVAHALAQQEAAFARTMVEMMGKVYSDIKPLADSVNTVETNSFRAAVLAAHNDFDEVLPKLEGWIKAQPAYLQPAYQRVYNDGTAQEIVALVNDYKKANPSSGTQPPATSTPAPTTPAKKPAADKAAALAPVQGKRTTPAPTGVDPNNYDDAFAEAAAQFDK